MAFETVAVSGGVATRADPSVVTEGFGIANAKGLRVTVAAAAGQTLSGTGSLLCWMWHATLGAWVRNKDLDLNVAISGKRGQTFADLQPLLPMNGTRVCYACSSVAVGGGATVTVYVDLF